MKSLIRITKSKTFKIHTLLSKIRKIYIDINVNLSRNGSRMNSIFEKILKYIFYWYMLKNHNMEISSLLQLDDSKISNKIVGTCVEKNILTVFGQQLKIIVIILSSGIFVIRVISKQEKSVYNFQVPAKRGIEQNVLQNDHNINTDTRFVQTVQSYQT
uniref:Uncharacterized protein n=1 Tax=Timema cristinae TaxID=61476 RepID=A0A7R9CAP4_TIMCR|nr:unnamed protein product [Timema cristinae]